MSSNKQCGRNKIARRLACLRVEIFGSKRSKSAFAVALGVPIPTYQGYESDRDPPAEFIEKVVEKTGCNAMWILSGSGQMWPPGVRCVLTIDGSLSPVSVSEGKKSVDTSPVDGGISREDHATIERILPPAALHYLKSSLAVTCKRAVEGEQGTFTLSDTPAHTIIIPEQLASHYRTLTGIAFDLETLSPLLPPPLTLLVDSWGQAPVRMDTAQPELRRIVIARVKAKGERKPRLLFAGVLTVDGETPIVTPPNPRYSPKIVRLEDLVGHLSMALLELSGSIKEDGKGD